MVHVKEAHEFTSLNDMLEQIKNIMSEESSNNVIKTQSSLEEDFSDKDLDGVLDGILELSQSSLLDDVDLKKEDLVEEEKEEDNSKAMDMQGADITENIDEIIGQENDVNIENKADDVLDSSLKENTVTLENQTIATETTKVDINDQEVKMQSNQSSAEQVLQAQSEGMHPDEMSFESNNSEENIRPVNDISLQETKPTISSAGRVDHDNKDLLSEKAIEETTNVLQDLIKAKEKVHVSHPLEFRSGTTIEQLVIEALKPQLSEWLNENLTSIVKNIVTKEIKKIIPKDE